jgi:hypothetical protein
MRPLNKKEETEEAEMVLQKTSVTSVSIADQHFTYDAVAGQDASQVSIMRCLNFLVSASGSAAACMNIPAIILHNLQEAPLIEICSTDPGRTTCHFEKAHDTIALWAFCQQAVFEMVGLPMVENCLAGFNSSIFAYGQVEHPPLLPFRTKFP